MLGNSCRNLGCYYENPEDKIYRDAISRQGCGGINHPMMPYNRDKVEPFDNS